METEFETQDTVTMSCSEQEEPVINTEVEVPEVGQKTSVETGAECLDGKNTEASQSGSSVPVEEPVTEIENTQEQETKETATEVSSKSEETTDVSQPQAKGKSSESPTKPKSKKKEDKSIEHILRALNSLSTTEEKLAALCKKYADLHEEHRVLQTSFKQSQRKMTVVIREKDQLQLEHTKAVMAKSKLESLCRELQKHNRLIKEESLTRAKEEDEKRKEISNKFQTTIGEIQTQMTDNHERNTKLREENADLAMKLKNFIEQYEKREQQVEKIMKHRELEKQLADAKLAQANAIMAEQEERGKKEKELLLLQATESQKKAQVLEAQLTMYKERYEEFQSTINRSNDMFQKFKTEMDKMAKRIKKLEKEGASWRAKWETSNKAFLDVTEQKKKVQSDLSTVMIKCSKLESLCRALQAELHGKKPEPVKKTSETNATNVLLSGTPSTNTTEKTKAGQDNNSVEETQKAGTVKKEEESVTLSKGANKEVNHGKIPNLDDKKKKSKVSTAKLDESGGKEEMSDSASSSDANPVEVSASTVGEEKPVQISDDNPSDSSADDKTPDDVDDQAPKDICKMPSVGKEEAVCSDYNIADVD